MLDSDNLSVDKSKLIYVTSSLSIKCFIRLGVFDKLRPKRVFDEEETE